MEEISEALLAGLSESAKSVEKTTHELCKAITSTGEAMIKLVNAWYSYVRDATKP